MRHRIPTGIRTALASFPRRSGTKLCLRLAAWQSLRTGCGKAGFRWVPCRRKTCVTWWPWDAPNASLSGTTVSARQPDISERTRRLERRVVGIGLPQAFLSAASDTHRNPYGSRLVPVIRSGSKLCGRQCEARGVKSPRRTQFLRASASTFPRQYGSRLVPAIRSGSKLCLRLTARQSLRTGYGKAGFRWVPCR